MSIKLINTRYICTLVLCAGISAAHAKPIAHSSLSKTTANDEHAAFCWRAGFRRHQLVTQVESDEDGDNPGSKDKDYLRMRQLTILLDLQAQQLCGVKEPSLFDEEEESNAN